MIHNFAKSRILSSIMCIFLISISNAQVQCTEIGTAKFWGQQLLVFTEDESSNMVRKGLDSISIFTEQFLIALVAPKNRVIAI